MQVISQKGYCAAGTYFQRVVQVNICLTRDYKHMLEAKGAYQPSSLWTAGGVRSSHRHHRIWEGVPMAVRLSWPFLLLDQHYVQTLKY